MSELPPSSPPPRDPTSPPEILSYRSPPPPKGLPIGVQALLGTIATGPATVVFTCILIAIGANTSDGEPSTAISCIVLGGIGLAALIGLILLATRLKRSDRYRGWAIGIYIGLGLFGLFWGTCGLLIYSISHNA